MDGATWVQGVKNIWLHIHFIAHLLYTNLNVMVGAGFQLLDVAGRHKVVFIKFFAVTRVSVAL